MLDKLRKISTENEDIRKELADYEGFMEENAKKALISWY